MGVLRNKTSQRGVLSPYQVAACRRYPLQVNKFSAPPVQKPLTVINLLCLSVAGPPYIKQTGTPLPYHLREKLVSTYSMRLPHLPCMPVHFSGSCIRQNMIYDNRRVKHHAFRLFCCPRPSRKMQAARHVVTNRPMKADLFLE